MRKTWFVGALAALIGLAALWYFASPTWTLRSMASAAKAGDADKLVSYIDFPKVQQSAKSQIKAQFAREMMGQNNGFAALGMAIAIQMVDPMIDAVISPEAMRAAFARRAAGTTKPGREPPPATAGATDKPFGLDTAKAEIVRDDFDHFRLLDKDKGSKAGELVFERRGFGWVLADIRMPPDLMKGSPPAGSRQQ